LKAEALNIRIGEVCHFGDLKPFEGRAEILALAQNRQPRQAGLKPFEADFFKKPRIINDRMTPFLIVIADILIILARPPAARERIIFLHQNASVVPTKAP